MTHLIDKSALVAEIDRNIKNIYAGREYVGIPDDEAYIVKGLIIAKEIIDTIEVKDVETWHLQEKEDIYDAVKNWGLYKFVCIMKDGTIQRFNGSFDEDCDGHINVHIDGTNDDYDDVADIVKWIEFT